MGLLPLGVGKSAPLWAIGTLGALAFVAERQPVRVSPNVQMTVAVLPMLFAAAVYGPVPAAAVTAVGLLADFGRPITRWIVWTSHRCITAACMGVVAQAIITSDSGFAQIAAGVTAAAFVEVTGDAIFGSMTVVVRRSGSPLALLKTVLPIAAATIPLHAPFVSLLVYTQARFTLWTLLLFIAPALAAQSLYRLYWRERSAREALDASHQQLERAHLSFAYALVSALDARDAYTAGHSAAVAVYARDLAAQLGLPNEQQELTRLAGLLHDIGKVGLPAGIIEKSGALTAEERREMEQHAEIGARILGNVESYRTVAEIVRHHHERIDGNGYPAGLRGDTTPLISRIIAVADAYDAMTSGRSYRGALDSEVALARLRDAAGTQFDPRVVAAFEKVVGRPLRADDEARHAEPHGQNHVRSLEEAAIPSVL